MKRVRPYSPSGAHARVHRQRGVTLIELMVGIVIAMLLSLAVFTVMATSESRKRSMTSVNDINQSGGYALYMLDKLVRGAGSGLGQSAAYAFGCKLHAAKSSTQVLPRTAALPAPFESVTTGTTNVFRLAPVLIAPGQTTPAISGAASDVLIVMSGAGGSAPIPVPFADDAVATTQTVSLTNTFNFSASDMVLVTDQPASSGGPSNCLLEQVATGFSGGSSQTLSFSGDYYAASVDSTSLAGYTTKGSVLNLGNASGNAPSFLVLGVGDHNTLYSYDLLQTSSTPLAPIVDGVFELHALYGLDTDDDGKVDSWVSPSATGYTPSALMDGSSTATASLLKIRAIRVGLIMRTSLPEKDAVATTTTLTLFSDLGSTLQYQRVLASGDEQRYRYRTLEATIPVRNTMLLE